jgi:hypothetical protein
MEPTVAYTAMLDNSRLLGANFRTARNRKRALAVALVTAAVVDNYQLEPLIEDSRKAMGYAKLDKPEQRQAKVFFSDLRTIVGAWGELDAETQQLFLNGNKVYSTLASEIAEARKKAEEAEAATDADGDSDSDATVTATDAPPSMVDAILGVAAFIEAGECTAEEADALATLFDAVDAMRATYAERLAA